MSHTVASQPNAARGAADQFNGAFSGERLEVFFGSIGGFKAQSLRDFCPRGGRASLCDAALDELQNLLLTLGQLGSA